MNPLTGAFIGGAAGLGISLILEPIELFKTGIPVDKYKILEARDGVLGSNCGLFGVNCISPLVCISSGLFEGVCVTPEQKSQYQKEVYDKQNKVLVTRIGLLGLGAIIGYYVTK